MAALVPVDHDPFAAAAAQPQLIPVEGDPFATAPAQPQPSAPNIPAPNAGTTEFPQEGPGRQLMLGTQAVGRGLAHIAGAPVDLTTAAINLGLTGADKAAGLFGGSVPTRIQQPFGGSENIIDTATGLAKKAGIPLAAPADWKERGMGNVIDFGTQGLVGGAGLARAAAARAPEMLAQGARPAFGDAFLKPYLEGSGRAVVGDVAAGAGSGAGVSTAQELPDYVRNAGGGAAGAGLDLLGAFGGGVGGAAAATAARSPIRFKQAISDFRTDPNVPLDENLKGTSNRVVNAARGFLEQKMTNSEVARAELAERTRAAIEGDYPPPTAGIGSGDIGLGAMERGARNKDQAPFIERDTAIRNKAVEDVGSVKPSGVTPEEVAAPRAEAERLARERVQSAEALGGQRVAETEAAGRQRVADAEAEARRRVAEAEQPVAQTQQEIAAAEAAARDQAAALAPRRSETVRAQASGRVHEAVTGPYVEARTAKNAAFDTLDPERTRQVDATGAIEAARRVRQNINDLGPAGQQLPAEFIQRLERLAPDIQEQASPILDAAGRPVTREVNVGGPGTAALGDLVDVRKYLSTAHENARRAGNFSLADNIQELRRTINQTVEQAPDAAAANAQYRGYADTYRPQPADEMAKFTREIDRGREPPPSKTAERFLSGPEKTAALRRVLDASPTQAEGVRAVRDYQLGEAASVGLNRNDTLNWRALAKWRDNNAEALRVFPNPEVDRLIETARNGEQASNQMLARLRDAEARLAQTQQETARELRTVDRETTQGVRASEKVTERNISSTKREIDNSAVGALLKRDPQVAVKDVFGSKDPTGSMREIKTLLAGNEKATRGWKANVADYFASRVSNVNPQNVAEGPYDIGFAKLTREFDKNRDVLAQVFSPKDMNVLQRAHKMLEPLTRRAGQAAVGSQTTGNEQLVRSLEAGVLAYTGSAITTGMIMRRLRTAASLVGLEEHTLPAKVNRLVARMWFDPELADHLMRAPRPKDPPEWNAKLNRMLGYGQAARDLTHNQEQK